MCRRFPDTYEEEYGGLLYEERFAKVADKLPTAFVLQGQGLSEREAVAFSNAMSQDLAAEDLLKDDRLRMMFEIDKLIVKEPIFQTKYCRLLDQGAS